MDRRARRVKHHDEPTTRAPRGDTPAFRLAQCTLEVHANGCLVARHRFDDGVVHVGAHPDNDLVVGDPTVSRFHCVIERFEDGWLVRDLDSTNGTWVDGVRVREAYLRPGNRIRLGLDVELAFDASDELVEPRPGGYTELGELVGTSPAMRRVMATVERIARTNVTVVVLGETGTGKEVVARTLHALSRRARHPFVVVDCAAVPRDLIESELFGHERGAFTGATLSRRGLFEAAQGGTVFIDEVGELDLDLQPRLLRVLERREVRRVGAAHPTRVDVRIVAATHRDLGDMVAQGRFRADLFYRLGVVRIELPALRDRREDIPLLAQRLLERLSEVHTGSVPSLSSEALRVLYAYDWPGNVRELAHVLESALALAEGPVIAPEHLPRHLFGGTSPRTGGDETTAQLARPAPPLRGDDLPAFKTAKERWVALFERDYLEALMARCGHNLTAAARSAGIDRKHLRHLLRKHGIERTPGSRSGA